MCLQKEMKKKKFQFLPINWADGMPEKLSCPSGGTKVSDIFKKYFDFQKLFDPKMSKLQDAENSEKKT